MRMGACMFVWMAFNPDGCMHGSLDGRLYVHVDGCLSVCVEGCMHVLWMGACLFVRMGVCVCWMDFMFYCLHFISVLFLCAYRVSSFCVHVLLYNMHIMHMTGALASHI